MRALLLVSLFLFAVPLSDAFTDPFPIQSNSRATPSRIRTGDKPCALWATSSRELRKREEGEKRVRLERRRKVAKKKNTKAAKPATLDSVVRAAAAAMGEHTDTSKPNKRRVKGTKKANGSSAVTKKKKKTGAAKKTKSRAALTQRLQQATARAKAAAIEADYASKATTADSNTGSGSPSSSSGSAQQGHEQPRLGTLTQLTRIIDKELRAASDGTATFNVHGTTNPPPGITRDSMRSLLEENDAQWQKSQRQRKRGAATAGNSNNSNPANDNNPVRHIAVVLSKPLVQDQVTLEYACRLRTLAKAMQQQQQKQSSSSTDQEDSNKLLTETEENKDGDEEATDLESGPYRPSIVCFLGATSAGNLVSDADAGYIYFKHLCVANQISLEGVDILLEKTSLGRGALKHVMRHLLKEYIPEWLKDQGSKRRRSLLAGDDDDEEEDDEYTEDHHRSMPSFPSSLRKKIQLHFTFFSCDYDLCRINDIHYRSPRQSALRQLVEMEDEQLENLSNRIGGSDRVAGMLQTTWSYRFSTYPFVHFKDSMTSYLGKCYLLAEELTPVLVNIRGVVDGTEFFQRDNYRVLVSIRRQFVNDMEQFYETQPSLKSTLRQYVSNSDYPLDVVLEGALLSLGRCLDLVRPAGLLIGYVPKDDWKTAEIVLQHAVRQLRGACDPDHPLDPRDWSILDDDYYDQHSGNGKSGTDLSEDDLMELTHWRTEELVD